MLHLSTSMFTIAMFMEAAFGRDTYYWLALKLDYPIHAYGFDFGGRATST